jgi:Flp pilus assembly protein TadG
MKRTLNNLVTDQSGVIAAWVAVSLVVLIGMAALAIDIGRLAVAKSELQKAADAGALAGARGLCMGPPTPNWTQAQNMATDTALKNWADANLIVTCEVQVGYWDYSWTETTAPANLKPTGTATTSQDVPAVKVTIRKTAGQNHGPLLMLFAPIMGVKSKDVSAQAVACAIPEPVNTIDSGVGFPLATPQSFVRELWDKDPPESFRIGSNYHDPTGGEWTSFLVDANDVPTIRDLINSGNPGPLKVGDQIWVQSGTKTTVYSEAANRIGETVMLPIVCDDFFTHDHNPILGFVPFKIEDASGGDDKYIQGHFVPNYQVPGLGDSSTPFYGGMAGTPKLVD